MDDIRQTAMDRFRLYLERRQFSAHTIASRSYWIPGSYAPNIVREAQRLFKAIEKEGLQGGKGDNNWVVRHRQIPRPWNPTRASLFNPARFACLFLSCIDEKKKPGHTCRMFPHEQKLTDPALLSGLRGYARYLTGFKDTADELFGKTAASLRSSHQGPVKRSL